MTVIELKIQSLMLALSACGKANAMYTPEEIIEVAKKFEIYCREGEKVLTHSVGK
jgi:hypothetical protein